MPELISQIIAKDEVILIAAPNHPLARKKTVTPEELSDYPFVLPSPQSAQSRVVKHVLASHGISVKQTLMIVEDAESIKRVVCNSMGLAVQIKTGVIDELRNGKLARINLTCAPFYDEIRLLQRSDKYLSPIQKNFIKFALKGIKDTTLASK